MAFVAFSISGLAVVLEMVVLPNPITRSLFQEPQNVGCNSNAGAD